MKIRIRRGVGNYGHHEGGIIRPKNYNSGAFEVTDNVGRNLIARGLADAVDSQPTAIAAPETNAVEPVPTKKAAPKAAKGKPAPKKKEQAKELDDMTLAELRAEAKARGITFNQRTSKAQLVTALRTPADSPVEHEEEEAVPSFDAGASID